MKFLKYIVLLIFGVVVLQIHAQEKFDTNFKLNEGIENPVKIYVLYDNYTHDKACKEDWGYACVVKGTEKDILFDTGTKPEIFLSNFNKLGLEADDIDVVLISHEHYDHYGGLFEFLKLNNEAPVLIPQSFSKNFKNKVSKEGGKTILLDEPVEVCDHVYSSGEILGRINEQVMVINTTKGLVVMTGCSHPGIINILRKVKNTFNKEIYMVFGGFHLMRHSDSQVESIIDEMKNLGVVKCGATHCTGDHQIDLFKKAFGKNYVSIGVGNILEL